jgi:hypothetical protein
MGDVDARMQERMRHANVREVLGWKYIVYGVVSVGRRQRHWWLVLFDHVPDRIQQGSICNHRWVWVSNVLRC